MKKQKAPLQPTTLTTAEVPWHYWIGSHNFGSGDVSFDITEIREKQINLLLNIPADVLAKGFAFGYSSDGTLSGSYTMKYIVSYAN